MKPGEENILISQEVYLNNRREFHITVYKEKHHQLGQVLSRGYIIMRGQTFDDKGIRTGMREARYLVVGRKPRFIEGEIQNLPTYASEREVEKALRIALNP